MAATLAAGFAPAASAETVIRAGHFPNVTHAHALVARAMAREGRPWFEPRLGEGVRIEWYTYNAGPTAMEAFFTGNLDITYVGPNPAINAHARSKGAEVRVVAGAVTGGAGLVAQGDSTLASPADFRGKKIATPQFGNTQDVAARAWLTDGGLRITQTGGDAQVIPTANPDQLQLFRDRALDAVWTVEPWVSRLEVEAGGKLLVEEKDALTTILAARAAFLEEQPALVEAFVNAHRELTAWIVANPDEAKRLVRDELSITFRAELAAPVIDRAWPRLSFSAAITGAGERTRRRPELPATTCPHANVSRASLMPPTLG